MKYCEHYAALLDPFVDGELCDEEADQVRAHLAECEGCRAYVEMALMMRDGFADPEETEVPDGFADGVMAAIRAHAAPRKKKAAPWVKVLLPLAACCAIVILVQGISRNTGLWSANTAAQTAADTSQAETEESSKALPDRAASASPEESVADASAASDDAAAAQEDSLPETYSYTSKTADVSSDTDRDSSAATQAPNTVYYAENGTASGETSGASNRDISAGGRGQSVTAIAESDGNAAADSSPQSEPAANGGTTAMVTTTLTGHLAIITLTADEAGDLLDGYTPVSQTDGTSCYELSPDQYQLLLEQLAQQEIVPENQLSQDQQVSQGTALVYVTPDGTK